MRYVLPLLLILSGCAGARPASSTYAVSEDGTVTAQTRSALDGSLAPGPQEIIGIALPFPPFMIKGGLLWDGAPVTIGPSKQASPCQAPHTVEVEETYTEMVPVQRTRKVQRQMVPLPVPQAAPGCCAGGQCR